MCAAGTSRPTTCPSWWSSTSRSVQVPPGSAVSLGGELAFTGSQGFDGDPSNLNAKLPSTLVVNLRAAWQIDERWQLFGVVDNLFDNRDALYGAYFDPASSTGLVTPVLTDPRTLTLRQPVSFQLGLKLKL